MLPSHVVQPHSDRLYLKDGHYVDVKRRLNYGEQQAMRNRKYMVDVMGNLIPNLLTVNKAELEAYVLGWSHTDPQGQPLPIGEHRELIGTSVDMLDPDCVAEMNRRLDTHIAAQQALRVQEKNAQAGVNGSSAISPSPAATDGPLPTCEPSTSTSTTSSSN